MNCVFCQIIRKEVSAHVVYEDRFSLAFLDKYPQTVGHLQLIPKKHYDWVYDMPNMGTLFSTAQTIIRAIIPLLGADHVTIATFGHQIRHAHIWIVPQYAHDHTKIQEFGHIVRDNDFKSLSERMRRVFVKEVSS